MKSAPELQSGDVSSRHWEEQEVVVQVPAGVHGRVATRIEAIARQHGVRVELQAASGKAEATSILAVLGLALSCGTRLLVRVQGPRAKEALQAITDLLTRSTEP